ncbi:MAG: MiaB/RimO family radical SAM methylthiotransferase [Clostridiales bacterium]|nr:MAG: MiaB/RimO family radical SAM methylthiotransferase [Clostridiales bacterium]
MKIEDGCNEFCTYCIIPFARGPVRSRKLENIVKEVEFLAQKGFCEVVLTGIHLASYGKDLKNVSLSDVICAAAEVPGISRIRLGSLEPRILTEEFIQKSPVQKKVCNHFHVSLQSGCDETLKRMNRKYTTAEYENSVKLLRRYFDNPAIATDIMVGFPGETDEEFEKSLAFMEKNRLCRRARFFRIQTARAQKADVMENQIDPKVKEVRHKAMESTVARLKNKYLESMAGKNLSVLFEQEISDGVYEGTAENYAKVIMKSDVDISKKCKTVKIIKAENGFLTAE